MNLTTDIKYKEPNRKCLKFPKMYVIDAVHNNPKTIYMVKMVSNKNKLIIFLRVCILKCRK